MTDKYKHLPLGIERQYFVPIPKGQKNPAHKNWQQRHFSEKQLLSEMNAGKNLGLITESYPCFDVDVDDGRLARKIIRFIKKLQPNCGIRTRGDSPRVILFYGLADDVDLKKQVIKVSPDEKVEFLAKGQQFVLHGKHPDGAGYRYSINNEKIDDLTEDQIADLFNAVYGKFSIEESVSEKVDLKEGNSTSESKSIEDHIKTIVLWKGGDERYESIKQLSFQYYKKSIPDSANILMLKSLMNTVPKRNRDGSWEKYMTSTRIDRLVTDLSAKGVSKDAEEADGEIETDLEDGDVSIQSVRVGTLEKLCVEDSNMEVLIDWLNGGGYVDNRMSAAISCFSTVAYYASGKFHLNDIAYNDKPNIYMLGVGDTGKGKEEITSGVKSINEAALQLEDLHSYMIRVIDDVASAQGIEDALYNKGEMHQDILLSLDEFGAVLPANDKDTRRDQLTTFLLRAFTYSQKKTGKRARAEDKDNKKSGMLDHAHLNVVGATTQENLIKHLTSSVTRLGLTSRMLMFSVDEYTDGTIRLVPSKDKMPSDIKDVLNKIIHSGFAGTEEEEKKGNIPKSRIKQSVSVKMKISLLKKAKRFQEDWQKKGNDFAGSRHRAYMNVKKLCLIQAIMEDPDEPVVDEDMLNIAFQYVGNSIKYQEVLFRNAVAESPTHAAELACVSVVLNNESKGMNTTNSILRRIPEMNRLSPRDKNEVMKELIETRKMFEYKVKSKGGDGRGRPTLLYFSKPR